MKNTLRALVVVLTLTGAAAAAHVTVSAEKNVNVMGTKASAFPVPTCPPDDPNGCGIAGN